MVLDEEDIFPDGEIKQIDFENSFREGGYSEERHAVLNAGIIMEEDIIGEERGFDEFSRSEKQQPN